MKYSNLKLLGHFNSLLELERYVKTKKYSAQFGTLCVNKNKRENRKFIECIKSFNRPITIVDFGGGSNMAHYLVVLDEIISEGISKESIKEYNIVDINHNHKENFLRVNFFNNLEEVRGEIDFFYQKSSLQYMCEGDILQDIIKLNPQKILFQEVPVAFDHSFYSLQIIDGYPNLPYKVYSRKEIEKFFISNGYYLVDDYLSEEDKVMICDYGDNKEDLWIEDFHFEKR